MKKRTQEYVSVELADAAPYAQYASLDDQQLLLIDDIQAIDFRDQALQTSFVTIAYCSEGEARFLLNEQPIHLKRGSLLIFLGKQILEQVYPSEDFQLVALLQSRKYSQETVQSMLSLLPYLLNVMNNPVIDLLPEEQMWVQSSYAFLRRRLATTHHAFLNQSVKAFMQVFYLDICGILHRRMPEGQLENSHANRVFYNFLNQLSHHYIAQREVAWYAQQLSLTPKYLSETVKQVSGRTASHWIVTMVILEIKSRLRHTEASIKEIASDLHFPNQSFLAKYFKQHTGLTPIAYRRQN